jgi:hypothetical protein
VFFGALHNLTARSIRNDEIPENNQGAFSVIGLRSGLAGVIVFPGRSLETVFSANALPP